MFLHMTDNEVVSVSRMTAERRYEFTVSEAARLGGLWGLWGPDGWAVITLSDGRRAAPVWPGKEFVHRWKSGGWEGYLPRRMDLDYFLDRWVTSTMNGHSMAAVFPSYGDNGLVVNPLRMEYDIKEKDAEYYEAA